MDMNHNPFRISADEREKLYNEVWTDPVVEVAKRYGISDVALRKRCKAISIPLPPRGYWEKLRAGQEVYKSDLPAVTGELKNIVHGYAIKWVAEMDQLSDKELANQEELCLFKEETKAFIKRKCAEIEIKSQLRSPHHLITEHKEEILYRKRRDKKLKQADWSPNYYARVKSEYRDNKPILPIYVSEDQLNRVYRIVDSLIKTVEEMEGSVSVRISEEKDSASFNLAHASFDFCIKEVAKPQRKVRSRTNSDDEANDIGCLSVSLIGGCWYDNSTVRFEYKEADEVSLESQLGKIVYDMFVIGSRLYAKAHLLYREQQREWEEEERQHKLEQKRQEERKKVEVLKSIVADWDTANKIRSFSDAVSQKISEMGDTDKREKLLDWLKWARARADWIDPLIEKEDDLLGVKSHFFDTIKSML